MSAAATTDRRRKNGTRLPAFGIRRDGTRYENKCSHDPKRPKLVLVNGPHAGMPNTIRELCAIGRDYFDKPHTFPALKNRLKKVGRLRRSERREAICLMLQELGMHTDLQSWQIGTVDGSGHVTSGRAIAQYMKNTGLKRRRVTRAIKDLVEAGYLLFDLDKKGKKAIAAVTDWKGRTYWGQQRIKKLNEAGEVIGYEALPARREWTAKFFDEAGLLKAFTTPRDEARAARRAAAKEHEELTARHRREAGSRQKSAFRRQAHIASAPKQPPLVEADDAKATLQLAQAILSDNPELGLRGAMDAARARRGTGPPE
jgi:hypothetical protein